MYFLDRPCTEHRRLSEYIKYLLIEILLLLTLSTCSHQETKCVLSGEKATLSTHDPCPESVPARLACWLQTDRQNINTVHSSTSRTVTVRTWTWCVTGVDYRWHVAILALKQLYQLQIIIILILFTSQSLYELNRMCCVTYFYQSCTKYQIFV